MSAFGFFASVLRSEIEHIRPVGADFGVAGGVYLSIASHPVNLELGLAHELAGVSSDKGDQVAARVHVVKTEVLSRHSHAVYRGTGHAANRLIVGHGAKAVGDRIIAPIYQHASVQSALRVLEVSVAAGITVAGAGADSFEFDHILRRASRGHDSRDRIARGAVTQSIAALIHGRARIGVTAEFFMLAGVAHRAIKIRVAAVTAGQNDRCQNESRLNENFHF